MRYTVEVYDKGKLVDTTSVPSLGRKGRYPLYCYRNALTLRVVDDYGQLYLLREDGMWFKRATHND